MSLLATSLALAHAAHAAPPSTLRVAGEESACPAPSQVATVLRRLLRRTEVMTDAGPADEAAIVDQGPQFRVTVAAQERAFADPQRACAERAQNAAVFIALVLDPPTIAEPAPEPVTRAQAPVLPPAPERPAPSPPPSGPKPMQWDLTLGGILLVAPSSSDRKTALSGGAQVWVRGKRGFHLGFGAGLLRGSLEFETASASAWWIPIDLAVGYTAKSGASELGVEFGPSASVLSIVGRDLQQAQQQVRLEIGLRASTWFRFWFDSKFAIYLSADGVARPVPYALQINPDGQVGHMPALWLGASAGLAAALD
jgi:hypothetical protein